MWTHIDFSPEYTSEILQMYREYYGSDNEITRQKFFQHQYFENPAGDAILNLAVDEKMQTVAGQYAICPMRFLLDKQTKDCVNSLNTLTREKYQKRGIFTGLAEISYQQATEKGNSFCYGVPNPNSHPGFIKKLSFVDVGPIPLLLRPLCPSHLVKEYMHSKVLGVLACPVNPFFRIREKQKIPGVEIVSVDKGNVTIMEQFWSKVKDKYSIMNIRDEAFIRFRYLDMPYRKYMPCFVMQDGDPVGFVVGRIMDVAGMRCGMLADFIYVQGYERAAEQLLVYLLKNMQEQGASLAGSLMLEHTQESSLLKKIGFFQCPKKLLPQPFPLIVRAFDKRLEEWLYELKNWFFTMGDYDVI